MVEHRPVRAVGQLEGAVEEIREELAFHFDVLLAARVGPWEIYRNAEGLYLSDEWQVVFGIKMPTELLSDYLTLFRPEERADFLEQLEIAFRHGVHAPFEYRHHLAEQAVLSRGRVVASGRIVGADLVL